MQHVAVKIDVSRERNRDGTDGADARDQLGRDDRAVL